jgi:hypothetical protein
MFANMKNYKIIKILQFDKLQVYVLKFTSLQITKLQDYKLHVLVCTFQIYKTKNFSVYKIKNNKIGNALLHIYKFAHARFSCFHTCMSYKITKFPITKYKNTKLQIANCKFINCMCTFVNFKLIQLKAFEFKITIITKIANTCLQICKITKVTNCKCSFAYLQVCTCLICRFSYLVPTHDQVCKFICFQVCKIRKFQNYKLIFRILHFHKLQVHDCKYEKSPNHRITNYKITKL